MGPPQVESLGQPAFAEVQKDMLRLVPVTEPAWKGGRPSRPTPNEAENYITNTLQDFGLTGS